VSLFIVHLRNESFQVTDVLDPGTQPKKRTVVHISAAQRPEGLLTYIFPLAAIMEVAIAL
jgi:hypothetical protein